ncbi:pyridoxal phosphate-dependent aminotransferase [Shouchella rhizosphaerae]|uniref:pyridoxal phosphate-dependent aminotransferase n=1 Tax=Shouchella rhizosphaerae TaxID=866786 RepID=UPI003F7FF6C3
MLLSKKVNNITPSSTLAITAKANALKEQGHHVIGLGAGEPDFNTPSFIIEAAEKSMKKGLTKYTPSGGIMDLKIAIKEKLERDQELRYDTNEIFVGSGAKHVLYSLFQAILNQGDEVIVPVPYWVSYPEQIKLANGTPVFVHANEENNFKIKAPQLQEAITEKTKAVIINSPSNPTGAVYSKAELKALADICLEKNILMISDEIYEKLIYTNSPHVSVAELGPEYKANTMIINGLSKSHSMTGWRIGFSAGNKTLIKAMANLASHSTSNPTTTAQYAAVAAYRGPEDVIDEMRKVFSERLNIAYLELLKVPGISCVKPEGAFYLFPNVEEIVKSSPWNTTNEWATKLLEEEKVAVVSGEGFGAPNNIRLSYATSTEDLLEGIKRIKRFVEASLS